LLYEIEKLAAKLFAFDENRYAFENESIAFGQRV